MKNVTPLKLLRAAWMEGPFFVRNSQLRWLKSYPGFQKVFLTARWYVIRFDRSELSEPKPETSYEKPLAPRVPKSHLPVKNKQISVLMLLLQSPLVTHILAHVEYFAQHCAEQLEGLGIYLPHLTRRYRETNGCLWEFSSCRIDMDNCFYDITWSTETNKH